MQTVPLGYTRRCQNRVYIVQSSSGNKEWDAQAVGMTSGTYHSGATRLLR